MKRIHSVLLDIDGTLIDSNLEHARCWQEYLASHGRQLPVGQISLLIGMGGDKILTQLYGGELSKDKMEKMSKERDDLYLKNYFARVRPMPGVLDFMRALHSLKLRIILATSSSQQLLDAFLEKVPVASYLDGYTTADDAAKSKPSPDIFLAAIKRFGLESARTVVIGDTPYDIDAARDVPCKSIAVMSGGFPYDMLTSASERYQDIQHLTLRIGDSLLSQ